MRKIITLTGFLFIAIFMFAAVVGVGYLFLDKPGRAENALLDAGYTEIEVKSCWFLCGCSRDDYYTEKFAAKGPTGRPTKGSVCGGFWNKGATIRLD